MEFRSTYLRIGKTGADPGFEKGGDAGGSRARPQNCFGQSRGLFNEFGTKRGGHAPPAPPPLWIRAWKQCK